MNGRRMMSRDDPLLEICNEGVPVWLFRWNLEFSHLFAQQGLYDILADTSCHLWRRKRLIATKNEQLNTTNLSV